MSFKRSSPASESPASPPSDGWGTESDSKPKRQKLERDAPFRTRAVPWMPSKGSASESANKFGVTWEQAFRFQAKDQPVGIEVFSGKPKLADKALVFHVFLQNTKRMYDVRLRRQELCYLMDMLRRGKREIPHSPRTITDQTRVLTMQPLSKFGKEYTRISLEVLRNGVDGPAVWTFNLDLNEEQISALLGCYEELCDVMLFNPDQWFDQDVPAAFAQSIIDISKSNGVSKIVYDVYEKPIIKIFRLMNIGVHQKDAPAPTPKQIKERIMQQLEHRSFPEHGGSWDDEPVTEKPPADLVRVFTTLLNAICISE